MRAIEVYRRMFLLAGVLAAVAMFIWPAQAVWRVDVPDFVKEQQRLAGRFDRGVRQLAADPKVEAIENPYGGQIDAFVAKRTEGRLVDVRPEEWSGLFDQTQATLSGSSTSLIRHLEDDYSPNHLYFPIDQPPLASLWPRLKGEDPVAYVRIMGEEQPRYLCVVLQRSHDAMRYAPSWVAFPWRSAAIWPLVLGLAAYCLVPVRRRGEGEYGYRQGGAVIVPDWIGTLLATFFFALPILIIASNASSLRPWTLLGMDGGWGVLTLILWGMAAVALANLVVGLWYATVLVQIGDERIVHHTLLSSRRIVFADVLAVEPAVWTMPRWLTTVMFALSIFNWRLLGPALIGSSSASNGMAIVLRDGRRVKLWLWHMATPGHLLQEFARRGIGVSEELRQRFPIDGRPAPSGAPHWRTGVLRILVFVLLAVAAAAVTYWPREPRRVTPPEPEVSPAVYARRQAILSEMQQIHARMEKGLEAIKAASSAEARAAAVKAQEGLMDRFDALHRESEQLDAPAAGKP